jgi:hypothetical protein
MGGDLGSKHFLVGPHSKDTDIAWDAAAVPINTAAASNATFISALPPEESILAGADDEFKASIDPIRLPGASALAMRASECQIRANDFLPGRRGRMWN